MKKDDLNQPKVSIVMPIYNGERFLEESLNSVLNQTFKDFELIIVNDSSTDNSLEIIKKYQDKRIKLINNKKNKGSVASYNLGLKNSKGKYVAICTQDDISHPRRIEIEFRYMENHPNIFLIGTSAIYTDENGKEISRFRKYDDYKMLAWRLRKSCGIIFPSIMFRNERLSFDNHFEYNLYYKLLKKGKNLTNIPNFLIKYRVHPGAESSFDKKRQEKLRDEVVVKFRDLEDNLTIFDKIYFSIKLLYHYVRTMKEKKISPFR
jgi:glycosyltransferase involved in cell wall biosynthesis